MQAAYTEGTTKERDGMGMGVRGTAADQKAASKASTREQGKTLRWWILPP